MVITFVRKRKTLTKYNSKKIVFYRPKENLYNDTNTPQSVNELVAMPPKIPHHLLGKPYFKQGLAFEQGHDVIPSIRCEETS